VTAVARVAFFDEPPALREDDDRRRDTLHELLSSLPGFVAGWELREAGSGRLSSLTLWESDRCCPADHRPSRARTASTRRLSSSLSGRPSVRKIAWTSRSIALGL
jgi:hypothetical protein